MYISKLSLVNYRNFSNALLKFNKGINTVIGENGSGKSNVFRAIRLLLDDNMIKASLKLDETDFHRGVGRWEGHWIVISMEFKDIVPDEAIQALFLHGAGVIGDDGVGCATYNLIFRPRKEVRMELAGLEAGDLEGLAAIRDRITIDDYETIFTGRSEANFNDETVYRSLAGDFANCVFSKDVDDPRIGCRVPSFLSITKEVSFTFIQALRDVVAEFHNNRTNPLLNLLKRMSGEISQSTMQPIVQQVATLNQSIERLDDVQQVRADIRDTIKGAAGETYSPTNLSIKSDLPEEADKLFQSLRLFVGESDDGYEGAIHELSLGGANLIFLTLKLLEFKYQKTDESVANFLLIEEPEAHIHTHIQKTLFDRISYDDTQVIYSTHSTHISEVCNIPNVNILGRNGTACEVYQPAAGLNEMETRIIERYLDAVRSNLLFARSVILVEGDAEEILIPLLVKRVLGVSLDELGVSLINIRSTGFRNVALLFHDDRIKKRCSIITDSDSAFIDTTPLPGDSERLVKFKAKCRRSEEAGAARRATLDELSEGNPWLSVHYADNTFEVDFIAAGNGPTVSEVANSIYSKESTAELARDELTSGDKALYGVRVLTMAANSGKGWFALLLGEHLSHNAIIPEYIVNAILFSRGKLTKELFYDIYLYRLKLARDANDISEVVFEAASADISSYRDGLIDVSALKVAMITHIPGDQIHKLLADAE